MIQWLKKHWEVLSYLIFGVLTTLLNILLYALFNRLLGYTAANSWGNVLDNILCILFAYATNRAFVFRSTKVMTVGFFGLVLGNLLAAQGAALMDSLMSGLLTHAFHWFGPDTTVQMASSYLGTPPGISDGSAAIAIIGGADGPTAIFVTSRIEAQELWGLCVKVFSNVIVVILNYVFSKRIVFKKK